MYQQDAVHTVPEATCLEQFKQSVQQSSQLLRLSSQLIDWTQASCWCRSSEQAGASDEEEELAGVLAEGIAKVLLHARIWSAATGKGLQVSHSSSCVVVGPIFSPCLADSVAKRCGAI